MNLNKKKYQLDNAFLRRLAVISLVYGMFMIVVWGVIAQTFPDGIEPPWLFWLIIGLSVFIYIAFIVIVELANYKRKP